RGGAGGMTNALRDAVIEKGTMTGTAKVSRKDGMVLVQDTKTNLLLKSPSSGTTVEQNQTSHLARKAVPPAAPVVPTTPLK
ncbi:MAG: hypothetical protein K8T90_14310, partial [Planctomycetes bacterium]|nr:hypothetical protein [Planctomycetota bacterium]